MTSREAGPGYLPKDMAAPGYTPAPQRAMNGDAQRSHTIPASQSTFTYNGQTIDLNALRQQTLAFGKAGYAQQQNYLAGLQQSMASQPANYGYDAATNAKLDSYIKSGGKGNPEDYGLGANLVNTPGFEDPLGTEAARINAIATANSDEIKEIAQQQYEDVKNIAQQQYAEIGPIAQGQNQAFNEANNPVLKKVEPVPEGKYTYYEDGSYKKNTWTYKGKEYTYEELKRVKQREKEERHRDQVWNGQTWVDKEEYYRDQVRYEQTENYREDASAVDSSLRHVTDNQEARNINDTNGSINSAFRYELQRPPDQLYYIQSLGQCLNRKYSGTGIFVDD